MSHWSRNRKAQENSHVTEKHNQTYHKYSLCSFKLIMYLSFHPNMILETATKYLGLSIQL